MKTAEEVLTKELKRYALEAPTIGNFTISCMEEYADQFKRPFKNAVDQMSNEQVGELIEKIQPLMDKINFIGTRNQWISVEERVPHNDKHCLIQIVIPFQGFAHYIAGYDQIYNDWLNPFGDTVTEKVTHWMELPNLPK